MCDGRLEVRTKTPRYYKGQWQHKCYVPCGKCPVCITNRKRGWMFRLLQEDKRSTSSYFVTLTYNNFTVPITDNGFLTLKKSDLQKYLKRLRKLEPNSNIKYYAVGEYGGKFDRPHMHIIMFNVQEKENIGRAWTLNGKVIGTVHIGDIYNGSIPYVLSYVDKKNGQIPLHERDDRKKEFTVSSKHLGSNYLTPQVIAWHKSNLFPYVVNDGYKIKMPKYYMDKIFTEQEKARMSKIVDTYYQDKEMIREIELKAKHGKDMTIEHYKDLETIGRWNNYQNYLKKRKNHV